LRSKQVASIESGVVKEAARNSTQIPREVYLLGFAQFLGGIGFSTLISSFAIFMLERYDFDALQTGFTMMAGSMVMVAVNVWGVPLSNRHLSLARSVVLGGVVNGLGMIGLAISAQLNASLCAAAVIFAGNALRGATSTAYVGSFTNDSNRGSVFAVAQRFVNLGRMIGPIVATHLADWYGAGSPFVMAGMVALLSAAITFLVDATTSRQAVEQPKKLEKQDTRFAGEWTDEVGSREDIESLGRFVADLLEKRHYQWVSKRADIERLLEHILPELDTSDRCSYVESQRFYNIYGKQF